MEIKLKSGEAVTVGSLEDLQDLYAQLHTIFGEKVKIIEKPVMVESPWSDMYKTPMPQRLSDFMPKPLEVWCGRRQNM